MGNNLKRIEISIQDLINILIKSFWIMLILMIIFAAIAYVYSEYYIVPLYRSEVLFLIDPTYNINYSDDYTEYAKLQMQGASLSLAKQLANTYIQILQTNNFRETLYEEYYSLYKKNMNGSISIIEVVDTDLFKIRVVSTSPNDAYNIATLTEKVAPEKIAEVMGSDKIRVTDHAVKLTSPINNNTRRNVVFGLLLGAILGYVIRLLLYILNTTVKDEEDLRNRYNIPILGGIIDFDSIKKNKYSK